MNRDCITCGNFGHRRGSNACVTRLWIAVGSADLTEPKKRAIVRSSTRWPACSARHTPSGEWWITH
jgi:hypothetical protein